MDREKKYYRNELVIQKTLGRISERMKEKAYVYEKTAKAFLIPPSEQKGLQPGEKEKILGRVCYKVCAGCEDFRECYMDRKDAFWKDFSRRMDEMEKDEDDLSEYLKQCRRREAFMLEMKHGYEILALQKNYCHKLISMRKIMALQMESVSRFFFELSMEFYPEREEKKSSQKLLARRLKKADLMITYLRVIEKRGRRREIRMFVKKRRGTISVKKIKEITERLWDCPLVSEKSLNQMIGQEETEIIFREDVRFFSLTGTAFCSRTKAAVSGDVYSVLKLEDGKQIYILADGMGSGEQARKESRRLIELMEMLLCGGIREEEAFKMANTMITMGLDRSFCTSIDVFSIQRYTGLLKVIKLGGAPSFIIRGNQVDVLRSNSAPVGVLWDLEFDLSYKKLYDGDRIVLISDGILDGHEEEKVEELKQFLLSCYKQNPQEAAEEILRWSMEKRGLPEKDDATVIVISVWRKGTKYD